MRSTLITAGVGLAAVLLTYAMLANERSDHAKTIEEFADYRIAAAQASVDQAIAAAEDARKLQDQIDTAIFDNNQLQQRLRQTEIKRATDRRNADTRIEELKRENEDLARWANTVIPGDWADFMCEPAGCLAPADPDGDGS